MRRYYDETGMISHYQMLLPKQLLNEFLHALHGQNANHQGITKKIKEARQKYYYPCLAKYIRNWVIKCTDCIMNKRINNDLLRTELLNCPDFDLGPEDALQMDILPNLPPSGGFENIITAIDVFSRYLFAYPVTHPSATAVAKVIMDIMCKHTYLPTLLITDKGSAFVSQVIAEVAAVLGITLKHATTKHAQTIGILERTHATIKVHLKAATGTLRHQWHKYLPLAVLNHNTTYHASIGCEPSRVFHGRIPYNILDHKLGYNPNPKLRTDIDIAQEIQRQTEILHDQTKKNIMQSYLKYKEYYDRKAKAAPLTTEDYCFILNPKADTQSTKIPFREFRWIGPYKIEKVLPNNNYIVRKIGTNKTQILHRIRLRKYNPTEPIPDIQPVETDWQKDEDIVIPQDDLYAIAWDSNFGQTFAERTIDPIPDDTGTTILIVPEKAPQRNTTVPENDEIRAHPSHEDHPPSPRIQTTGGAPETEVSGTENYDIQNEKTPERAEAQDNNSSENPRGSKYNLRPNPNPNFSDSYRY